MARAKKRETTSLHDDAYKTFVRALVKRRKASGLSQQALADQLGWQQSIVAKIETAQRRLDVIEFLRLTTVIGTDPIKLLREIRNELDESGELPE